MTVKRINRINSFNFIIILKIFLKCFNKKIRKLMVFRFICKFAGSSFSGFRFKVKKDSGLFIQANSSLMKKLQAAPASQVFLITGNC
jgi:hypothetical protein